MLNNELLLYLSKTISDLIKDFFTSVVSLGKSWSIPPKSWKLSNIDEDCLFIEGFWPREGYSLTFFLVHLSQSHLFRHTKHCWKFSSDCAVSPVLISKQLWHTKLLQLIQSLPHEAFSFLLNKLLQIWQK